jgi:hypothetical protein
MSVLRTNFTGAFDSGLFAKTETAGTVTQTGGEILFNGTDCFVVDVTAANFSADNATVQISTYPAANNDFRFFLGHIDAAGAGIGYKFSSGGVLVLCSQTSGTPADLPNATISSLGGWSTTYTYVRLRHAAGTVYLEISTDDVTYTGVTSTTHPVGFVPTAAKTVFGNMASFNTSIYGVTNYWAPALGGAVSRAVFPFFLR